MGSHRPVLLKGGIGVGTICRGIRLPTRRLFYLLLLGGRFQLVYDFHLYVLAYPTYLDTF